MFENLFETAALSGASDARTLVRVTAHLCGLHLPHKKYFFEIALFLILG
jgi:hypothetical protein